MSRWREGASTLVIAIVAVSAISWWQTRAMLTSSEPAPDFARPVLDEPDAVPVGPSTWRGRRTLVYFFAPWCGVCKVSASNLRHLRSLTGVDDTEIVAVALDYQDVASVRTFAVDQNLTVPVVLGDDAVRDAYKITAYPSYYILDGDGRIVWRSMGYSTLAGMAGRLLLTNGPSRSPM